MNKNSIACIKELSQKLLAAYDDPFTAEQNSWALLQKATGLSKLNLIRNKTVSLSPETEALLSTWIKEIIEDHKPIQYILGSVPFLDLTLTVEPPILIPRLETEEWCHRFIEHLKKRLKAKTEHSQSLKILDLCTGSGCIALAIAHAFPHSMVYASDISPQALTLAQKNAKNNNISNIVFIESNLYNNIPSLQFDYIVSNPPYITPEEYPNLDESVSRWEDKEALVANDQGLAIIRAIIAHAPQFLKRLDTKNNVVWIEIGYQQAQAVQTIFHQADFATEVLQDLCGNDRVVVGSLHQS